MMRILLVLACACAVAVAQQQPRGFRPAPNRDSFNNYDQQQQQPQQQQAAPRNDFQRNDYQQQQGGGSNNNNNNYQQRDGDRYTTPIPIVRFEKEQSADGSYKASYETGNNIVAEETGFLKNVGIKDEEALVQHGSYTYTGDDGVVYTVTYTADEQGFRPEGIHLPTPPPVPAEIQKSLDLIYASIREQQELEARQGKLQKIEPDNQGQDNYPNSPRNGFRQ